MATQHTRLLVVVFLLLLIGLAAPSGVSQANTLHKDTSTPTESGSVVLEHSNYVFPTDLAGTEPVIADGTIVPMSLIEGFEGSWPSSDWLLNTGPYTIGRRDCHPHSGQYAGWMAGGGSAGSTLNCSDFYPDNMNTSARYGPFDLHGATHAVLHFSIWGKTEYSPTCIFDKAVVLSSTNGTNFSGMTFCGDFTTGSDGNGYQTFSLDLSQQIGQAQVWILFGFISDSSINDLGIAVDDISLDVTTNDLPTATGTPTPTGLPVSGGDLTISGTIRSINGTAIGDAQVIGFPDQPGQSLAITQTAADGSYTLSVPSGNYHIQASRQDFYAGHVYHVTVPPSQSGIDMILNALPGSTPTPTSTANPTNTVVASVTPPTNRIAYLPLVVQQPPPTLTPTPTSPPGGSGYDGTWSGTTSQNKVITFVVSQNGIASMSLGFADLGCGFAGTIDTSSSPPKPLQGNTFIYIQRDFSPTGVDFTVSGAFASATTVRGSIQLTQNVSFPFVPCHRSATLSWTATR